MAPGWSWGTAITSTPPAFQIPSKRPVFLIRNHSPHRSPPPKENWALYFKAGFIPRGTYVHATCWLARQGSCKDTSPANAGGERLRFITPRSSNMRFEATSIKERSAIFLIYGYIRSTTHELLHSENRVHNPSDHNSAFRIKIYVVKLHCFKLVNLNIYFTQLVI